MKHPEILRISTINAGWCDKDIVMLHACFQLLVDCVESENLLNESAGRTDEKRHHAMVEVKILYDWWKKRLSDLENSLDELNTKQYAEDNEMLIRLINVRHYLWT